MTATICLTMIVRDEEARLANCLNRAKAAVDEIVIVDTGSTDGSVALAKQYTEKVYHFPWNNDFSAARNYAIEHSASDWILCLDADEQLDQAENLRALIDCQPEKDAFFLPIYQSKDGAADFDRFLVLRLFRNKPEYRYCGEIHEHVPVLRQDAAGIAESPVIRHLPSGVKVRRRKRNRNISIIKKALEREPENCYLLYYLGAEWYGLGRYDKAADCLVNVVDRLDAAAEILFRAPAVRTFLLCLKAQQRFEEALALCLEEIGRYPEYTDILFDGGMILEGQGEYEAAIRWFNAAIANGSPPAVFYHTHGTEGFLALYHLGYCYEKSGQFTLAKSHYEKALKENPVFEKPLYNLFFVLLRAVPVQQLPEYFTVNGFLARTEWAAVLAGLFYEAGYPELAHRCIAKIENLPLSRSELFTKIRVYGGFPGEVLGGNYLAAAEGKEDIIVALLLTGHRGAAKAGALAMWRSPTKRPAALALLNLIGMTERDRPAVYPEKRCEPEVIGSALKIMDNCLRCRINVSGQTVSDRGYAHLAECAGRLLTSLSAESCRVYAGYLQAKADNIKLAVPAKGNLSCRQG